jgi:hypothetical protein
MAHAIRPIESESVRASSLSEAFAPRPYALQTDSNVSRDRESANRTFVHSGRTRLEWRARDGYDVSALTSGSAV